MDAYDLIVIGSGTAAQVAIAKVRAAGWSVAVIDHLPFGGTCALRGCDPKKMLVSGEEARRSSSDGRRLTKSQSHSGMNEKSFISSELACRTPVVKSRFPTVRDDTSTAVWGRTAGGRVARTSRRARPPSDARAEQLRLCFRVRVSARGT
ncbi:FAD-dependent oxidoreductase [Caulobacter sp. 3R27C2-B]|uniref:FAD-dependent oxidoreductase n=1 Tax=Caulobacter sp. 3R27C2-B TaxID=2502219 RepID=UPI0020179611|nr:FAD-dependent oxidoreductase [Caulobacter sp. 3R27C2-B]